MPSNVIGHEPQDEMIAVRLAMDADAQILASAVMNPLTNAFKYTPAGGQVVLRALHENGRVDLEVEDECGSIPDGTDDPLKAFTAPVPQNVG